MKVDIVTLFPEMLSGPLDESILKRAREKGLVEIRLHGLRDFTRDKHKMVDDRPLGVAQGWSSNLNRFLKRWKHCGKMIPVC